MFTVQLAEINIGIENKYDYVRNMCSDYITDIAPNFTLSVSESEIESESKGKCFEKGYLESLALYRKIAEIMPKYNGFLMHGAVVEAKNCGIAFLAKSGVGKTTHVRLWQELLKDKITVINGDKPLVGIRNGKVFAYGTAWAGKENMQTNTKTELKKICFIERSEENECLPIDKRNVFKRLIPQIYIPRNEAAINLTIELMRVLIEKCDFYLVKCNKNADAAKVAYRGLEL